MKKTEKLNPKVTRYNDSKGEERVIIEMEMSVLKWNEVKDQLNIESSEQDSTLFEDIKNGLNEVKEYYEGKGNRYSSDDL